MACVFVMFLYVWRAMIFLNALSCVPICMPIGFVPRLLRAPRCNCSSNWWSDNPISTGNVSRFPCSPPHHQHHIPLVAQLANSSPWERCSRQSKFPKASWVDMQAATDRQYRGNYPHNLCTLYMRRCECVFFRASTCVFRSCQIF